MEEIPSTSDYSLINSFITSSYNMTEKYALPQNLFQQDFDTLEEQLEFL